jgi:ribonuclease HII
MAKVYRGFPTLSEEIRAWRAGHRHVAGLDEVGRGPMAGPVVAAAVILEPQFAAPWWSDLRDSKLVTQKRREDLAGRLRDAYAFGLGSASNEEIDTIGLVPATRKAMVRALSALPFLPDLLLIDAVSLNGDGGEHSRRHPWRERPIIHGDGISVSVAAASIIAKVERDRLMDEFDSVYPQYGFGQHRGYCTAGHLRALERHGPSPLHRRSFAPVRAVIDEPGSGG